MDPEQTTPETLTQTANRARNFLAERGVTVPEPTVSAQQLAEPVQRVTVPEIPPTPGISPTLNAGVRATLQNVRQTAQGAQELAQRQEELASLGGISAADITQQMQERFGVTPERLRQLQEYESNLAAMAEESALAQTRMAAGNSASQLGMEVTQEQRELAVRSAATAAQAEILRGNIEQGRALAKDAVAASLADREFRSNLLIRQIDSLQGQVNQETQAALDDRKFQIEQELASIQEVKDNVADAIASGAASASEVQTMTDPNVPDATKLALAQSIVGRGASEDRQLSREQQIASIRSSNASAARAETGRLLDLAEAGDESAIAALGLTMPDNTIPTSDEIAYARQYAATGTVPAGLSSAGVSFGRIQELAADLPKPDGTIVNRDTGVAPGDLSASERTGYENLYNAINTDLPVMLAAWEQMNSIGNFGGTGVVGGIASTINPSEANTRFETAKADFIAKLLVARSGAAVTEQEYQRYAALIPGAFNTPFGIGTSGTDKLNNLNDQMTSALNDKLSTRGLSIYGYSTVNTPEGDFTVGEIITNEYGQRGRVNPDGSVTPLNL